MKKLVAILLTVCMVLGMMTTMSLAADAKSDDIVVLYTNDVHCAVDNNIGYAGLAAYKKAVQATNNYVALVDCGDAVQGDVIGTLSKGEYLVDIMNEVGYDYATFGNHEFDYGMDVLQGLVKQAKYQYLCCNLTYTGTDGKGLTGYKPYAIATYGTVKVAYVGVDTPESFTKSTPTYFQDANGKYVYSFAEGNKGADLYASVQKSVDAARKEGATYVVLLAHLGTDSSSSPWQSTDLIANTTGVNVVLDGHSHSVIPSQEVKDKDGKTVLLSSTGTKLANIGKLTITKDGKFSTELISKDKYTDKDATTDAYVKSLQAKNQELVDTVVAKTSVDLTIKAADGTRAVRNRETNLGDLCADAYRILSGADIAFVNGGGIRADLTKGNITYGDIIAVHPYGNALCVVEASGQEIKDALEWTARNTQGLASDGTNALGEMGGFLQVSGLKYTIDTSVKSSVVSDDKTNFVKVDGAYRVKDIQVLQKDGTYAPLVLTKTYTLASHNYMLKSGGDGINMFKDNKILQNEIMIDNQVLINYIKDSLGGVVPESYAKPQGRITVLPTAYSDIADGAWYVKAVNYVTDNKIMNGTGKTFMPAADMSRAMLVTMLYREAGSPAVTGKLSDTFTDCKDDAWYSSAILWAVQNKIVNGYGKTFAPEKAMTREEMAKTLYTYAVYMGAEKVTTYALSYTDAASIADWAKEGVAYCSAANLMVGTNGNFLPNGTATRSMGAQVLMNIDSAAKAAAAAKTAA